MNGPINPNELEVRLKTLWGASQLPFGQQVNKPFVSASFSELTTRLEQLVAVRACGVIHGPNGVGKSLSVQHFLRSLPEKRFKSILISHSSLSGSDLLRVLCAELGRTARMRRGDNLREIRQGWQECERLWPVLVLEEAQNFNAAALEEIRLLSSNHHQGQLPFSLLLVGDTHLLPRLQMGVHAPLLTRMGFSLCLKALSPQESQGYFCARLEEAGIHANPFEEAALQLLLQSANGLPRSINHLAQRAMESAAEQESRIVSIAHIHRAIELLPWIARL